MTSLPDALLHLEIAVPAVTSGLHARRLAVEALLACARDTIDAYDNAGQDGLAVAMREFSHDRFEAFPVTGFSIAEEQVELVRPILLDVDRFLDPQRPIGLAIEFHNDGRRRDHRRLISGMRDGGYSI